MGTIGLSGRGRPEEASEISEIAAKLKEAGAQLYSAQGRMLSTETVAGTPWTAPYATQLATLIYLSFTNSDISIAIAGCGVTLEAGPNGA
jgi:hypothetical protein